MKITKISFRNLFNMKNSVRVGTDDYIIYAIHEDGRVFEVSDMGAEDVSDAIWHFLGIDAEYLDEKVLGIVEEIENNQYEGED